MKKLIIIALLTASHALGGTVDENLASLSSDPNVIVFVNGNRVHQLINPENVEGNHYLKASRVETWDGFNVSDIPRFVGVHVKHAGVQNQHITFFNLIESLPDSHGGFITLNSLLETVRKNPHLTKLVFRWTLQNEKRFGVLVGHEIMKVAPDWYMEYREIVDQYAPEMQNTFELGYVWLDPKFKTLVTVPEATSISSETFATE